MTQPSKGNEDLTTTETIQFVLEKHGHRDIQAGTYKHIEQIVEQAKDAEREKAVEDFKNEVLDILENHTIVRSGDHPFVMKKVRCPENRTISDIRKDVKALPTHH